jgi:hypothetical protein
LQFKAFITFLSMASRKLTWLLVLYMLGAKSLVAEDPARPFVFRFGGFVQAEFFSDSRRMLSAREGNVPLYPDRILEDPDGNDLNAVRSTTFSLLSSRLNAGISGPMILGARTSALFEIDFMGTGQTTFNLIRLRHAFVRFNWENTELLAGQYWHPLFIASCFPGVVAFGGGAPFHVLNRGPQIRLTHTTGPLTLAGMLVTQSDFASPGPAGTGSAYIRNSGMPEAVGQAILQWPDFLAGGSVGYLRLRPRTTTENGFQASETMGGFSGNLFIKAQLPSISVKVQTIYGQNMAHLVMLGGYGEADLLDTDRQAYDYAGIGSWSAWTDLETRTQPFRAGLFAGYSQNLGSDRPINGNHWARGPDVAQMFRISPRVQMVYGSTSFSLELLYDIAYYGNPDEQFRFEETIPADNTRLLAAIRYGF